MIKGIYSFVIVLICNYYFSQSFLVGLIADKNINKKILTYKNENGSTLVYLPTVHTGKKEYFESVKKVVDSLRKENFLIAYEGILMDSKEPNYETNAKKLRKVVGFHIGNMKPDAWENLPDFYKKKKYLIQSDSLTGINRKTDSVFDIQLDNLINEYEKKYGTIQLEDYDISTPLNAKYNMKNKKGCIYCITQELRDPVVGKKVEENKDKNIVLLFGKAHKYILHAKFLDLGYKLVSGKL